MGSLYGGSWLRRWSRRASATLCGLALVSLPGWAEGLPQPPLNSDVAFRIMPSSYGPRMEPEILREQPLIRLLAEAGMAYLGFDPLMEVDQAFEGTVVGAAVSDPKKASSLGQFFKEQELRSDRDEMVRELQSLQADLESFKETEGKYPEDFRNYIDEHRYYEPYLPPGVSYEYQRTEGGEGFRLVVSYDETTTKLAQLGPPPVLGNGDFAENLQPNRPPSPLNFVLGARVADAAVARQLADRLLGEPRDGFWTSNDDPPLVATMRGSWIVLSDRKENLGPFLKSLQGQAPGLSKNPKYQLVARNIDMEGSGMAYIDLPRILKPLDLTSSPEQEQMLDLMGPAGYSVRLYEKSQFRLEAFLGVRPPKGSALEKVFQESAESRPEASMAVGNIPWDVSNAFAIDYRLTKKVFDGLVALSPESEQAVDMAEDVWAGLLGLDAERGFDNLVDGWAILSLERMDIFVNAFEGFSEAMSASAVGMPEMEGVGGPPSEDAISVVAEDGSETTELATTESAENADSSAESGDPSAGSSEPALEDPEQSSDLPAVESPSQDLDLPGPAEDGADAVETSPPVDGDVDEPDAVLTAESNKPPRLPFTVAFRVSDEQARKAIQGALDKQLGEEPTHKSVYGVEVLGRQDGLLSYALREDWFYISGGNTQRLLRNLLAAATGRKESLTSLDSWSRFRAGQRGQVVALGHQKLDGLYSLVKGGLLFLGPDFRPMAYELGGLRDYHSAAFIVPDGMLLVGDVLQGDGR